MEYDEWIKIKKGDSQRDIDFKEGIKVSNRLNDYLYGFGIAVFLIFAISGFFLAPEAFDWMLFYIAGLVFLFGFAICAAIGYKTNYLARIIYRLNTEKRSKK